MSVFFMSGARKLYLDWQNAKMGCAKGGQMQASLVFDTALGLPEMGATRIVCLIEDCNTCYKIKSHDVSLLIDKEF